MAGIIPNEEQGGKKDTQGGKDTNTEIKDASTKWGGWCLMGKVLATEASPLGTLGESHVRHHVTGEISVPSLGP